MEPPEQRSIAAIVVYALPHEQTVIAVDVSPGTTIAQAVRSSGLLRRYPELDGGSLQFAIYGRTVADDTRVREGDRIEVLRPLSHDPKDTRRKLAARGGTMNRRR